MTIRYTRPNPCPVCGGGKDLPQGHGVRCFGYTDATGQYARCTREEHAGGVPLNTDGTTYSHRIRGSCRCGNAHAAALPQNRVRETSWRVYGLDGSYAVHWRKDQPDGSKRMWWAHADGTLSKNGAISGKDRLYGLELVDRQTKGILVEGEKAADALRGVVPAALLVIG